MRWTWSGGGRIKFSNTKFGSLAALAALLFFLQGVFAAELQPIPPVTMPPPGALPPAYQPALPTAVIPPAPGSQPPSISASSPGPVPTTAPPSMTPGPDAAPLVSQPMRPVSPETIAETEKRVEEEGVYFNVADEDLREVVKQISRALGKNFILDDKVRGKITIISERKMTKDEIWEAFQSALDVNGLTIIQGPAGLLRIVPTREALSNPIDLYTDSSPFSDRFMTRLITLRNINASDMANVIKGLVSKEGNLYSYPVTNTLILTDKGTNIDRLMRLITVLDHEGPQEVLEIIPILYADAKDIAAKITQIFETDKTGGAPASGGRKGKESEIEEAPRLKKVIPDDRTNSLIVLASKIAIKKVRDLIKKLDSPSSEGGEVHVYYLKNANAKDMVSVLTAISGAVQQAKDKKGGAGAPGGEAARATIAPLIGGAEFVGKFTVTADESTNAIVITAGAKDYNTLIDQVISKLDIPRRQVYVESVIVELSVSENQQMGAGLLGGRTFNVGGSNLSVFGSTFGFLDPSRLLSGTVGGASDQKITINSPGTPSAGGTTGGSSTNSITVPAFFSAIQFDQANTDVNILSTPNILTLDNQEAEIKVGQKVPFPAASATTIGGSLQTTFTREDVTLSLKIKPQINEGGTVRMEVTQEDRNVLPPEQQASNAALAGPSTTLRSIKTAIVATNGQTVVLGGLIKDRYENVIHKVPFLGDIPILGYLFKTKRKVKEKVNLVVFLTPHIITEPRDFLAILQKKINEQNAFVVSNFGRSQQKQIKKSLETHASHLLEFSGEVPPSSSLKPGGLEEQNFPMELGPAPFEDKAAAAPRQQSSIESPSHDQRKSQAGKNSKPAPTIDLVPDQPGPSGPSPTEGDIDLAY